MRQKKKKVKKCDYEYASKGQHRQIGHTKWTASSTKTMRVCQMNNSTTVTKTTKSLKSFRQKFWLSTKKYQLMVIKDAIPKKKVS
jgi:hypothetical protein